MTTSAGSIPCPPFITDEYWHRRAITNWMFQVSENGIAGGGVTSATLKLTSGATLVGFQQGGTSAVTRTVALKIAETVSITDFDVSSSVDCVPALTNACAYLGTAGGTVVFPARIMDGSALSVAAYFIDSSITIPSNITLQGPYRRAGAQGNSLQLYDKMSTLQISVGASITLAGNSGIDGMLIHRKGMSIPSADGNAFTGTAIVAGGDDTFVINSMIFGFGLGYKLDTFNRPKLSDLNMDNQNNIEITNCQDVARGTNIHMWPFASIQNFASTTYSAITRTGIGLYLHDTCDGGTFTNIFDYGHFTGFKLANVNANTFLGCGADYPAPRNGDAGSRGFTVEGAADQNAFIGCLANARENGFCTSLTASMAATFTNCTAWDNLNAGFQARGDVTIVNPLIISGAYGIQTQGTAGHVVIVAPRTRNITLAPIVNTGGTKYLSLSPNNDFQGFSGTAIISGGIDVQSISAAGTLYIPPFGDSFTVAGTAGISSINGYYPGRLVTLHFTSNGTIFHGGAAPNGISLAEGGTCQISAGCAITLRYAGGVAKWVSMGRTNAATSSFSGHNIAGESISAATWTSISFGSIDLDDLSEFDGTTFTAGNGGTYVFNATVQGTQSTETNRAISLYVNGVERRRLFQEIFIRGESVISGCSGPVFLTAGATATLLYFSTLADTIVTGITTSFSGWRIK